jgi:hypothetical protein
MTDYIKRRPTRLADTRPNNIIESSYDEPSPYYARAGRTRQQGRRSRRHKKSHRGPRSRHQTSWKAHQTYKKTAFEDLSTDNSDNDDANSRRERDPYQHMKVVAQGEVCVDRLQTADNFARKYACASELKTPEPQNLTVPKFF